MVALAEVTSGGDGEDANEGEGKPKELGAGDGRDEAAKKGEGEGGAGGFGEKDEELSDSGNGEMEMLAQGDGDGGEPNDQGWIGVKEGWAVEGGTGEPAVRHEEEPELVVPGGWKERKQSRHAERCGEQDLECFDEISLVGKRGDVI